MKKNKIFKDILILSFVFFYSGVTWAAEEVTITTYYPSPYGSYRELSWGSYPSTRGRLKADQGSSLELGGSGSPYIDFSNDMASDYDMRIALTGNNQLTIQGAAAGSQLILGSITRVNTCVLVEYGGAGVTVCPNCYYTASYVALPSGYMLCCMVQNPPAGSGC